MISTGENKRVSTRRKPKRKICFSKEFQSVKIQGEGKLNCILLFRDLHERKRTLKRNLKGRQ